MRGIHRIVVTRRVTPLVLAALLVLGAFAVLGVLARGATAQPPSSGNGAARFDDLRELNNKLSRTISKLEQTSRAGIDEAQLRRTLKDLEATKLRAVSEFPPVFGLPYSETFTKLSCIDEELSQARLVLALLDRGLLGRFSRFIAHSAIQGQLEFAKACKDSLEGTLAGGQSVPAGVLDDLRELNNKLTRAISKLEQTSRAGIDEAQLRRTLKDLEATKLRAVGQFPEVLDPPYIDIFTKLSCIDEELSQARLVLALLDRGLLARFSRFIAHSAIQGQLEFAKACKDTLEVELMHSFNLKPSEQASVGVNATTPNGTDTQNPNKLNAPKTLEHAYPKDGFVGRHEQDYLANGVSSSNPDSWPSGRSVLFFDVFDLFGSTRGAQKADKASQQNLKSSGFTPVQDSSLGPGEGAFQHQAAGSSLLSTIIYVQRGTFIMKIAGACNGCQQGSIDSSLKAVAQTQLNRAAAMGFPTASSTGSGSHIPEEFETSGNAPENAFGRPGQHLCLYLHGPAGQTGTVKVEPGDASAQTDPYSQTYDQAFTLDSNGTAFFSFTEPGELFKITINRLESDGSTDTTVTAADPRVYNPPPWGLPNCT